MVSFAGLLPRLSILIAYFGSTGVSYIVGGWVSVTLGVFIPRALVLLLIFRDREMSPWLLIHALVMASAYRAAAKQRFRNKPSS